MVDCFESGHKSDTSYMDVLPLPLIDFVARAKSLFGKPVRAVIPDWKFSKQALEKLLELANRPNPELTESPFLGVGENDYIDDVYTLPRLSYLPSEYTAYVSEGQEITHQTHFQDIEEIYNIAWRANRLREVQIFGHTHTYGLLRKEFAKKLEGLPETFKDRDIPVVSHPQPSLPDVHSVRQFMESGQSEIFPLPNVAILACSNEQSGRFRAIRRPTMRVYSTSRLIRVTTKAGIAITPYQFVKL